MHCCAIFGAQKQPTITQPTSILQSTIEYLKGVGPQRAMLLRGEVEISTFEDLLNYFPYRYFDRTRITPIADILPDAEQVQIAGTLINIREEGDGRKRRLAATLFDNTGRVELVWFQSVNYLQRTLRDNTRYIVFGKPNFFNANVSISHPEIELQNAENNAAGMQPVYSTTQKLIAKGITNRSFAKLTQSLFQQIKASDIPEVLPYKLMAQYGLMNRPEAYQNIHFPASEQQMQSALYRLKWEELFLSQVTIGKTRLQHNLQMGWRFNTVGDYFNTFYKEHLPFALTSAQKRVLKEIRIDTATGRQMNRLLQGDVGSGKTIVAVMCMLLAMDNGFQACIMAPTEILARQHYQGVSDLLEPIGIPVGLLIGAVKGKERKTILANLANGSLPIVIGTHALIEDTVQFKNLGLAVIDEQHRFGVGQRARLWKKNSLPPHVLVMTATPIPRTMAMTYFGDLDKSVIDELPPGRQEIKTVHRTDIHRARVMEFIRVEIDKGRQVYIVYPLIEESEKLDYESLMAGYEQVKSWFPEHKYKIAMVHGRQDTAERERNMQRFVGGDADILVATTVIEVGVNVPNASVMIIESAERFGLSQMHQLRGRVGRGAEQSYCILLTGSKLSNVSRERLKVIVSTTNGFEIAEEDLKLRGPGDVHGTRQSGALRFKLADIVADSAILEAARDAATQVLAEDPNLSLPENAGIRNALSAPGRQSYWGKIS